MYTAVFCLTIHVMGFGRGSVIKSFMYLLLDLMLLFLAKDHRNIFTRHSSRDSSFVINYDFSFHTAV